VDEISQREKREVLRNDSYFSRQQNTPDDAGGRYAKLNPAKITGSTPSPVPHQPPSSHWAKGLDELTGREGPLGFDIEFVGDLGGASPALASTPDAVETIAPPDRGGSPIALTGPPHFLRRRRV
jgi:hypothetical protein